MRLLEPVADGSSTRATYKFNLTLELSQLEAPPPYDFCRKQTHRYLLFNKMAKKRVRSKPTESQIRREFSS
jgi:hypothetical protein